MQLNTERTFYCLYCFHPNVQVTANKWPIAQSRPHSPFNLVLTYMVAAAPPKLTPRNSALSYKTVLIPYGIASHSVSPGDKDITISQWLNVTNNLIGPHSDPLKLPNHAVLHDWYIP